MIKKNWASQWLVALGCLLAFSVAMAADPPPTLRQAQFTYGNSTRFLVEMHGVPVFLQSGEVLIGESGKHRLTIAQLLELPVIPVRVGHVHVDALPLVPDLRRMPPQEPASTRS